MQAAQEKKKKVRVGNVISVYWPEDKAWYHGEVISLGDDDASSDEICEVLYEDGEREVINLKEEKYKISNKGRSSRNVCLLADGDVHAQLASIREILYDIGTCCLHDHRPLSLLLKLVMLLYDVPPQIPLWKKRCVLCTFCMLGGLSATSAHVRNMCNKKIYSLHFVGLDAYIADRLPSKGVSSSRQAWWQAWYEGIDSAVEASSIPLLVSFVEKLAQILRPSIKTNWWKIQVCCCCSTCCSKSSDCIYTRVYSIFVISFLVLSRQNVLFCLSSFLPSSTSESLV